MTIEAQNPARWLIIGDGSERTQKPLIRALRDNPAIDVLEIELPAEEWKIDENLRSATGVVFLFHEPRAHMHLLARLADEGRLSHLTVLAGSFDDRAAELYPLVSGKCLAFAIPDFYDPESAARRIADNLWPPFTGTRHF